MCKLKNEIGNTYSKLMVIEKSKNRTNSGLVKWICKCECGNIIEARGDRLRTGKTKSCGCSKHFNEFIDKVEYIIGIDSKGEQFTFDKCDYEFIKQYCWYVDKTGYVVYKDKKGTHYLHRVLMKAKIGQFIDHINNNKKDNRRENLRFATQQQNNFNKSIQNNNTSGIVGVRYDKSVNKWIAYIGYNNKNIRLGAFKNKKDAIKVRKEAEKKYFGEFAHKTNNRQVVTM
ncbi:HNH endonuclease [Clostridium botulinum]|uniref:HNH endonuclease n=1 Tax=Clostridium botulinum TaxID=1491 RepID=UPI00339D956A